MANKKQINMGGQTAVNYPVGDFMIRLKNAAMAGNKRIETPTTKLILEVAKLLKKLKYVESVEEKEGKILVDLAFHKREPIMAGAKIVSRPGLRIYKNVSELENHKEPTDLVVSTTKGILSGKEAIKNRIGGEVIAEVW
jgi:small subunit ribosomal protein S8